DLGAKRIGIAISDRSGIIASPHSVIPRSKSRRSDHERIRQLVEDEEIEIVVVGLPLTMDGRHAHAARAATEESRVLATVLPVPVELFDERMTTVAADRALREAEIGASARREFVDKVAAAVLLQTWLDRGRSRAPEP
ncbi:MAG: Holliday junction resolvase RuvX, partial [Actinomycetota bacterium]